MIKTANFVNKEFFVKRSYLLKTLRNFFEKRNFVEVQTPIIHNRLDYPLTSHYEVWDNQMKYYLRICMELRLRQLLALGLDAIFEIGPCFRKEKEDGKCSEFYLMECFKSNITYEELISLTEECFRICANSLNIKIPCKDNIPRISVINGLISENKLKEIKNEAQNIPSFISLFEKILDEELKKIKENIFFLENYPLETMSLANRQNSNGNLIERFELFIWHHKKCECLEIAHGFMDSTDFGDIEFRMDQLGWKDEPLLSLIKENRLPPSGGVGIGIERLAQSLLDIENIFDVIIPQEIKL